jgi:polysaccharide export outer membrane protein
MKYFYVFIIVLLSAVSCVTTRQINYLQKPGLDIPNYADTFSFQEYKLQTGDYIHVRVYSLNQNDVALYNGESATGGASVGISGASGVISSDDPQARLMLYLIDENGNIDFPYIGLIPANGKTIREFRFEMRERFKVLANSGISVDVQLANRYFSVIGDNGSKRVILPHEKTTIFQALALVGDLSTYSDRSKVKLIRQTENGTIVKEFDLRTIKLIDSQYYYIQPNDVLYVQHTFAKYVGIQHIRGAVSVTLSSVSFVLIVWKLGDYFKKKQDTGSTNNPPPEEPEQ